MMMRAGDPALPEEASATSEALADYDRRARANMPPRTKVVYEVPMSDTTFILELVEWTGPLQGTFRVSEVIISEMPRPAPTPPAVMYPSSPIIPQHRPDPKRKCEYLAAGNCYWCCSTCNTDDHRCGGCGEPLDHNGRESNGQPHPDCT